MIEIKEKSTRGMGHGKHTKGIWWMTLKSLFKTTVRVCICVWWYLNGWLCSSCLFIYLFFGRISHRLKQAQVQWKSIPIAKGIQTTSCDYLWEQYSVLLSKRTHLVLWSQLCQDFVIRHLLKYRVAEVMRAVTQAL